MEIKVDREFKSLIPPISPEELRGLEESIINEGCRDPLVLWEDVLLDGHNRLEICQRNEIKYKTVIKCFDDRDQAKLWIICNQLGRRNLSSEQASYLRGLRYQISKGDKGGDHKSKGQNDPLILEAQEHARKWHGPGTMAEKLAKEYGVSEKTIKRDAKFAEAVDKLPPEEKEEILSGKSPKTKKEIIEAPKPNPLKMALPSNGLQFARLAIMDLEKITDEKAWNG